ncbi:MAG: hypothetical protein IKW03_01220 [Clostridia bacterium]|nr:hypothetical protein [Clostridia bacterium]
MEKKLCYNNTNNNLSLSDKLLNDVFCRWQKMMYSLKANNDVLFHKMMFLPLAKMSEAALRLEF